MSDELIINHRLVCAGFRLNGKELCVLFFKEGADYDDESGVGKIWTAKKALRYVHAGSIYEFRGDEECRRIVLDPKYVGSLENDTRVAAWQLRSRSAEARHKAGKDAKTKERKDRLEELLAPVAEEWRRSTSVGRMLIEVQVLAALRV